MARKVPPAPCGLGTRGRRLWREVHQRYSMNLFEVERLAELCKVLDSCDRIAAELARSPQTVEGAAGQVRPHPLLAVLQNERRLADRLATSLLPGGKSGQHVKAANARWSGGSMASVSPIGGAS